MKKLVLVLSISISVCLAAPVIGQNYVHHDTSNPSGGSVNVFPFGNAFGNNWRYQLSVPAATLPRKPVRFTEVAFAPSATGTFSVKDFQLRMAHTGSATLTSIFANNFASPPVNLIDVQGGNYTFKATANQWTPLGSLGAFDYDGVRPLVIEIRYRGFGTLNQGSTSINSRTASTNANRIWANGSYPPPGPPDPYSATVSYGTRTTAGIRVRLTYIDTVILLSGNPGPGGTIDLNLLSLADGGRPYQVASSLGTGPIPIGNRTLKLTPDNLMLLTVNGYLPSVFVNYAGTLDAAGKARAQIKILNDPRLKGVRIHSAFITLDPAAPFGIKNISNTASFSIT